VSPAALEDYGRPARYAPDRLFLVAVVFIVAAPVFWRQVEIRQGGIARAYENVALYQQVYPAFQYGFTRLRTGDVPLWNPNEACGTPFLADPATGLFQPINALFLYLPTERAMAAHAYVCLSLMGLFFVLFGRALGVGYIPALVGGVAYAFCGAAAAAMSHPALANALAWTPFMFWGLREYGRRWRPASAVLAGLGGAMLLLSGSPALIVAVLCLWVPYGIYLVLSPGSAVAPGLPRRLTGPVVMGLVALVVSAVQWAPTLAWAASLERPVSALWRLDLVGLAAQGWREMLRQLLMAKSDTLPHIGYVGISSLLAIPAVLFHKTARRDALFFLVAGPAFLFVAGACGKYLPFSFPAPAFAIPGAFCVAVLTALGLDRLLAPAREPQAPNVWAPALFVLIAAGALLYVSSAEVRGRIVAFFIILLPFLLFRTRWVGIVCGLSFALLLFVDLTLASVNRYRHPFEDAPECYRHYAEAIGVAQEQALGGRVLVSAHPLNPALPANLGMLFPVAVAGGAQIPLTKDQAQWWARLSSATDAPPATTGDGLGPETVGSRLLDFMAVRAILAAPDGPLYDGAWAQDTARFREVRTQDDAHLVINEHALPRAYCVPTWREAESVEAALDILSAPDFDARRACVVLADSSGFEALAALAPETLSPETGEPLHQPEAATCTVEEVSAERIIIHVEAPAPGVTVLADTFAPGWGATLDGIPWPILQVNAVFRGIATPAGAHDIIFDYRPLPFTIGLAVSIGGSALLVLLGMTRLLRSR